MEKLKINPEKDLEELEQENKKLESDLYEANNRIKDLLEESEE